MNETIVAIAACVTFCQRYAATFTPFADKNDMLCSSTPAPPNASSAEQSVVATDRFMQSEVIAKTPLVISASPSAKLKTRLSETSDGKSDFTILVNMYTSAINAPTDNTDSIASVRLCPKFLSAAEAVVAFVVPP